jgi:hypothetical protein
MKFSLTNKYIFYGILFILVFILTGINNYYFYAHIERASYRNAKQLKTILEDNYKYCIKNNSEDSCKNNLISITQSFSVKAYYNDSILIKEGNTILWEKPKKDWDKIVKSDIIINLYKNKVDINYKVLFSTNMVFISVIRSMTFSFAEFSEVAYEQGIKEAINKLNNIYWYRSRPFIGFMVFTFLLLYFYRKKELQQIEEEKKQDEKVRINVVNNISIHNDIKINIINDISLYSHIISPPINLSSIDELLKNDLDMLGTKFRKAAEKVVFQVYEEHISKDVLGVNLSKAINKIHHNGLISDNAKNYLDIIRVYGNMSAHYSDNTISKEEAMVVISSLNNVLNELSSKNLIEKKAS